MRWKKVEKKAISHSNHNTKSQNLNQYANEKKKEEEEKSPVCCMSEVFDGYGIYLQVRCRGCTVWCVIVPLIGTIPPPVVLPCSILGCCVFRYNNITNNKDQLLSSTTITLIASSPPFPCLLAMTPKKINRHVMNYCRMAGALPPKSRYQSFDHNTHSPVL